MKKIYVWNDRCGKRFNFTTKAKLNSWIKELADDMLDNNPNSTKKQLIEELSSSCYISVEYID